MNNTWKDVVGYEGVYKINEDGIVRGIPRKYRRPQDSVDRWTHDRQMKCNISSTGYNRVVLFGKPAVFVHKLMQKAFKLGDGHVDHIDGNKLNNKLSNLRICTQQENMRNQKKRKNCKSQFKGVGWSTKENKWIANICISYKTKRIGAFANEIDAAMAYDDIATRLFGDFARLNFSTKFQNG